MSPSTVVFLLIVLLSGTLSCERSFRPPIGNVVYTVEHKMQELVEGAGYPLEEHFVETADGYVLGVYRIPHGRLDAINKPRPTVILQHGLLDSSAAFVLNQPDQSLGFILADQGYDVWMSNSRGNAFSRNHTGLLPSDAQFWDFTWQDMTDYDLPAVFKYVIRHTGVQKVSYVGHSQGCTQMMAALSFNQWMRETLDIFIALAPATYVRYVTSIPLITLAKLQADQIFDLVGSHEFLPARQQTAHIFHELCRVSPELCVSVVTAICGYNGNNLNLTRLSTYVEYAPSGSSVKNMAHWAQMVRQSSLFPRPIFRRYDYGTSCYTARGMPRACNRRMYASESPPEFNLSKIINVPIALFSGAQDRLADPVDMEALIEALPEETVVFRHSEQTFEHLDFTWGLSAATKIYPHVLRLLEQFSSIKSTASS